MPITELRIEGLRTIEKIRLELGGLTVLIGDNGTGKSSILEACEILRRATDRRFMDELYGIHGGLTALLRQGAPRLTLGVTVQPAKEDFGAHDLEYDHDFIEEGFEDIEYELAVIPDAAFGTLEETVRARPKTQKTASKARKGAKKGAKGRWSSAPAKPILLMRRRASRVELFDRSSNPRFNTEEDIEARLPFLVSAGGPGLWGDYGYSEAQCVASYLKRMLVHLPFETIPAWAARALDRKSALRTTALLAPAAHLEKLGVNLASAYHALRNGFGRDHWDATLSYIRLGLGQHVEDIVTWVDPGGGHIGLSLKLVGLDRPIPSAQLSDGMLSYLAFVAMFRLHATKPTLVAFDEPDLHLHPHLLMRVLDFFESMARSAPVLLATHSDRLLDGLTDPAKSVVLCALDERGATRLVRPDPEALSKWLERYRGLGDIRGAGHAASVLTRTEPG